MSSLLEKLRKKYPQIRFEKDQRYRWSASQQTIYYSQPLCKYSLLHELGHALNDHQDYQLDIELIRLESEAWESAKIVGDEYETHIRQSYIESCLDTYRDWLLRRSKCPECEIVGMQSAQTLMYTCMNCGIDWKVPQRTECVTKRVQPNTSKVQTNV